MSRATISSIVAATVMTAAGLLTISPPAQADAACTQFGFSGPFELAGGNGWWVKFNANGTTPRSSAR
jgi:hypothetical protein